MNVCKEAECGAKIFAKNWCLKHYKRVRKYGTTKLPSKEDRFWSKVKIDKNDKCWNWIGGTIANGYGMFWYEKKLCKASRVVWFLTYRTWPKLCILHVCDNPLCVNPNHLFEGNNAENSADMVKKGRQARGSRNGNSKLTETDVKQIKRLLMQSVMPKTIAEQFHVSRRVISSIKTGKIWKWLDNAK